MEIINCISIGILSALNFIDMICDMIRLEKNFVWVNNWNESMNRSFVLSKPKRLISNTDSAVERVEFDVLASINIGNSLGLSFISGVGLHSYNQSRMKQSISMSEHYNLFWVNEWDKIDWLLDLS